MMLQITNHRVCRSKHVFHTRSFTHLRSRKTVVVRCEVFNVIPAVIGSALAFTSTYPMDTYKTLIQNDQSTRQNLFKGYKYGLALCCSSAFIYFNMYQKLTTMLPFMSASFISSIMSIVVKVPGKAVTKLLQNGSFLTLHSASSYIMRAYGPMGFYRGFLAYVMDDVPETVLKFFLFDYLETIFPGQRFVIGALTGILCSILLQPLDVLQTMLVCNIKNEKINYTTIDYTKGMFLAICINSIQNMVFYYMYYICKHIG